MERKNILVLFSKVPEVGLVKTRLSILKDGILAPDDAAHLYHCMLFDVVECICAAMADLERKSAAACEAVRAAGQACPVQDTYELMISTTPAENVPVMRKLFEDAGQWPRPLVFDYDEGANFDIHYNCAFQKAWDRGADCILSMGADMPALTKVDVRLGFQELHKLWDAKVPGIVLAPDQEMGVSVVGWNRTTPFDHTGVYYCQNGLTVLPAYIEKAQRAGLRAVHLPAIPDVDTVADLRHNITLVQALNYCAESGDDVCPPWRTYEALKDLGLGEVRVMPNNLMDPREHIDF
ncbi:MAG: DUF2064 domain-containing protein [Coriobacteriia bacterium]|nr:DUF2064 domain-containing protein [Coriobacteriia bacterium]